MWNRLFAYCPAPLQNPIISCFFYIQTDFIFLIPAYLGCPGKEAIKWCNSSNSSSLVTMTSLHHDDVVIGAVMSSGETPPQLMRRIIAGLTECLLCEIVVSLFVESCYWCDWFARKTFIIIKIAINFLTFQRETEHVNSTALITSTCCSTETALLLPSCD